jgi:hypothetical protein
MGSTLQKTFTNRKTKMNETTYEDEAPAASESACDGCNRGEEASAAAEEAAEAGTGEEEETGEE